MLLVVLLALGACTCAATSTVLKHRSTRTEQLPRWADRLPVAVASIVANPLFLLAMIFDAAGIGLQITALRFGDLSVVQPILAAALVISLGLDHALDRTPVSREEIVWGGLLVGGLVLFLVTSGAVQAQGEVAVGQRGPGIVLSVVAILLTGGALLATRSGSDAAKARALALTVAVIYATTAGLMKSVTRIASLRGLGSMALSWQLWLLLAVAALGLVLNQHAFALAPLTVSLPVVASLDPLFSVVIGVAVYAEDLRTNPLAIAGEVVGLGTLLVAVFRLSRLDASRTA